MTPGEKLSDEAKMLIREYVLRVTQKKYPDAIINVQVGDRCDDNGRVERRVTIKPRRTLTSTAATPVRPPMRRSG